MPDAPLPDFTLPPGALSPGDEKEMLMNSEDLWAPNPDYGQYPLGLRTWEEDPLEFVSKKVLCAELDPGDAMGVHAWVEQAGAHTPGRISCSLCGNRWHVHHYPMIKI